MSKVLVINAHPQNPNSRTLKILHVFLKEYQNMHPNDQVDELDLYEDNFPEIDSDLLSAWGLLRSGQPAENLNGDQKEKLQKFNDATNQFLAADKIVIANPMWNLNIPTKLKAWIDAINVAGKTFKYTVDGPIPLTHGKKALHIQAAGGKYENKDFGTQYVKAILNFVGVESVQKISVEGMDNFPEEAAEIVHHAEIETQQIADAF
ncbi:FMN-dependent NADH-azoreductase [Pediococcus siamensis]|uniref:FMN-dependent NADH-azoreductase n=1 Tax=Pediococcus siamensis TaxID=381829 RepID=UPI0039A07A87